MCATISSCVFVCVCVWRYQIIIHIMCLHRPNCIRLCDTFGCVSKWQRHYSCFVSHMQNARTLTAPSVLCNLNLVCFQGIVKQIVITKGPLCPKVTSTLLMFRYFYFIFDMGFCVLINLRITLDKSRIIQQQKHIHLLQERRIAHVFCNLLLSLINV